MTLPVSALAPGLPVRAPYATQPWNRIVWPGEDTAQQLPLVYDAATARRIPGVARALGIYGGMIKQMSIDAYRGITPLPRPSVLAQPDPTRARPWFVQVNIEDYLLNGNALVYITARDASGWPAALAWLPASWVSLVWDPTDPLTVQYALSWDTTIMLNPENVIHVRRGAAPYCPARGVGVVEEMLRTLDTAARQQDYERANYVQSAVPSVAVITPNPRLGEDEAREAKTEWLVRYGGSGREPGIFPAGTQVIPLSWSPNDAQLTQAKASTLVDLANAFNLDGYWLGAPGTTMTYRSPGPMYLNLLRVSLEPVLADFEDVWSQAIVPRGQAIRFNRSEVLHDDMQTTVTTLAAAVNAGLYTRDEARVWLGLPLLGDAVPQIGPLPAAAGETDEQALMDNDSAGSGDDPAPEVAP